MFKPNTRVRVVRNQPRNRLENAYGDTKYLIIGWKGTLVRQYSYLRSTNKAEWVIKWDQEKRVPLGDLVKEWMIEEINEDWDD